MHQEFDVIVTGSEGYIGSEFVSHLKKKGYEVACVDLKLGHNLRDSKAVDLLIANMSCSKLITMHGTNDHFDLAKNTDGRISEVTTEAFTQILENNVSTTYGVCKAFMKTRSSGRIINMSSIYGVVSPRPSLYFPDEKNVAYGVSKAAIIQLTRHLAVHAAPRFTVNSIVLGGIERNHDLDFTHKYSQGVPMGRMGQIGDVLPLLETLLFEQSEYLTGTEITLDGGYTAL